MKRLGVLLVAVGLVLSGCSSGNQPLVFTGSIEAKQVDVSPEITGVLKNVRVQEGTMVSKGAPLIEQDTSDYNIQLELLKTGKSISGLKSADIQAGNRPSQIKQAAANVANVEAQISGAKMELGFLEKDYQNTKTLFDAGTASQQQLDTAQRALDKGRSQYQSLLEQKAAYGAALNLLKEGATQETKSAAQLDVEMKDLQIKDLVRTIEKGILKSPADGLVQSVNYEPGERLTPGMKAVTLLDIHKLELKIYVPEKELHRVYLGMQVAFKDDFLKGKPITGTVSYISGKAEFTPKNIESKENKQEMVYEVRIQVKDPSGIVKPGMFLDAELKEGS